MVSLMVDVANEGTRSVVGPYLTILGAGAVTISIVSGLGELIGYGLRIVFGWIADERGHYWILCSLDTGSMSSPCPPWRSRGTGPPR